MNHINELKLESKQIWVQGLMIDCPMRKALETCPAKEVRKLPLKERLTLVSQMDESQLNDIITYHKLCLREREGG